MGMSKPVILNEAQDYIDGLMLSDGHIENGVKTTGRYSQHCKYKEWLDVIHNDLYKYGVESKVNSGGLYITNFSSQDGSIIYMLRTCFYTEFRVMKDRWYMKEYNYIDNYPKRLWHVDNEREYFIYKKIVPRDICLSSECIANWYLGDGNVRKQPYYHGGYQITLATNGFLRKDVLFLSQLLSEVLDINCGVRKDNTIGVSAKRSISAFLDYIKDYKVECYSYKFPEGASAV